MKKLLAALAAILLGLATLNGPANASDGLTYQEFGREVTAPSGLRVALTSLIVTEKTGSVQLSITYRQSNPTTEKKDEGSFKLFFTDGTSEPQYGLFNSLFPADSNTRSYTWEWVKGKEPWLIEWEAGFFAKEPSSSGLKWKVGDKYPTPSQTAAPTTGSGDVLYSLEASNYNPTNGQWLNSSGGNPQFLTSSVASGTAFPAKGGSPASVVFNGATNGHQFIATEEYSNPQVFSQEVWFATNGSGKIIGFERSTNPTGNSSYDRHLYVGTDGKLYFGIFALGAQVLTTSKAVNDGKWHHAVAVYSQGTAQLYLDGTLIQSKTTGLAEGVTGFWRIGGNRLSGWTNGVDGFFSGQIGEVRIFNRALSATDVSNAFSRGRTVYGASSTTEPEPSPTPATKPITVNGVTYQPLGVQVKAINGMLVTISDLQLIEKTGSTQLRVTYNQVNGTKRTQLDEGSFKLFFTDGSSMGQGGFFYSLFPGDGKDRTHTFEWVKGKKPWLIEWESDFFASKPAAKNLKWKVGPDYPAVAPKKYANCTELNKVYSGGVARSSKWVNKGAALKQSPTVSSKTYDLNKGLDRDKDGLACER